MRFTALPQRVIYDPRKSPHVLRAGNSRGKSGSGAATGARRDPAGGGRRGSGRSPRAGGAGGERGPSLRSPCTRGPTGEPRPREPGQPSHKGLLARPLLGERPSTAQGDGTELPRRPARLRPAESRRYRDAATAGHGDSGTQEERAPSPERGGAPAANTRREQDGGRGRKERRTEKGSAAPRDGASPPADGWALPPHLHRGGGYGAQGFLGVVVSRQQQSPALRGRERCPVTQTGTRRFQTFHHSLCPPS